MEQLTMKNLALNKLVYILLPSLLVSLPFSYAQKIEVREFGSGATTAGTMISTGLGIHEGDIWVWGFKGSGQQGNGKSHVYDQPGPVKIQNMPKIASVTGGAYHILAIDVTGQVWGWGQNGVGETGCGNKPKHESYVNRPCLIRLESGVPLQGVSQVVSVGEYHSVYLDKNGDVYTSGTSTLGRLGQGENSGISYYPRKINLNGERARVIGAQYEGGMAVTYEGNVWGWGDNELYGLAYPVAPKHLWTPTKIDVLKPYAHDIITIGGGQLWGGALLKDGTAIGWGVYRFVGQGCGATYNNTNSHIPVKVPVPAKITQLIVRYDGSIALTEDNEIYTWGTLNSGEYAEFQGWCPKKAKIPASHIAEHGKVIKIGSGKHNVTYEMEDGTTWGLGFNDIGALNPDHTPTRVYKWPGIQLPTLPPR